MTRIGRYFVSPAALYSILSESQLACGRSGQPGGRGGKHAPVFPANAWPASSTGVRCDES